jgi:asparagine synthase (glutamine-hydrolysing)
MQTVSDVPVGLFLSGGIDSSSLAGILSRAGIRLNTFSIVFREAEYNESEYSRAVARAFSSEHQAIMVSQRDVLDAIPYALKAMDQPTIDGLNTFLVSRAAAKQGLKVALSGLGGDEIFGGYPSFRQSPKLLKWTSWIPGRRVLGRAFQQIVQQIPPPIVPPKAAGLLAYSGNVASAYVLRRTLHLEGSLHPTAAERPEPRRRRPGVCRGRRRLPLSHSCPLDVVAELARIPTLVFRPNAAA